MKKSTKIKPIAIAASLAFSATAAMAATTPYDLIRPTWPLSWDSTAISKFDTTVTKKKGVLNIPATPASFKAGALMPDTLDQAYLDAINTKISSIRVNQAGYLKSDMERQFYYVGLQATNFEVVDADGKSLSPKVTGTFTETETETASDWTIIAGTNVTTNDKLRYEVKITGPTGKIFVGKIPQSVPTDKRLRIKVDGEFSSTFIVSDDVYTMAKDATLKFLGIQRSGNSESWFHGPSHLKDGGGPIVTGHKDVRGPFDASRAGSLVGGWYDCGDHLKESQTQAFTFMALAVMSATNHAKDVDHYAYNQAEFVKTDGIPDVLREAKHGADFFLRAFNFAKGVVDDMPVSVGNFGSDHGAWSRPEAGDGLPTDSSDAALDRGGPASRTVRLGELGSNVAGEIIAGLAILAKDYKEYDKAFADSCLMVAEKMYGFAKSLAQGETYTHNQSPLAIDPPTYQGNNEFVDDMAVASVALLYATGKKDYADDMIRAKDLYPKQSIMDDTVKSPAFFRGGWFVTPDRGFFKNVKNTSWANTYTYALYALYKLILADKTKATTEYGLTEEERLAAIENCLANMIVNLGDMSYGYGTASMNLPTVTNVWKQSEFSYDPTWYTMFTDSRWVYNGFRAGDIFDVLAYADIAADIEKQGITLSYFGSTDLKTSEMKQFGINQLNYLFGINPWDISFVYGVGDKNDAHPHHRASNPEGRNMPGYNYKYTCPTGALIGGVEPDKTNQWRVAIPSWEYYDISETCLHSSATLLSALTIVSNGGNDYYEKKCDNCKTGDATPFADSAAYVTAYTYNEFDSLETINLHVVNESLVDLDSVTAYIYFEATQEDVDSCGILLDLSICQAYDMAGFNRACANHRDLMGEFRKYNVLRIDTTYNKESKTYTWVKSIQLPTIEKGTRIRLDISASSGKIIDGKCETLLQPSKVKLADGWSFTSHKADKDAPAYEGAPAWDKDDGDIQEPPQDPYVVLRTRGKLLWGYGPANTTANEIRVDIPKIAQKPRAQMLLSRNTLYVQTSAQGTKTVKIFDMLGNQLTVKTFDGSRTEVNLANLPRRGAMIARVVQNNKVLATRAIRIK